MSSRGPSAGARRPSCPSNTGPPIFASCRRLPRTALSITSVEAMAAGKPVVASRIGGLPYTVTDGVTGLLFEPGNPFDLAEKIARLLDDPALRRQMGLAGRKRFEEDFTWEDVIKRYWRPLLGSCECGYWVMSWKPRLSWMSMGWCSTPRYRHEKLATDRTG